jgi:hypothetical protein
MHQRTVAARVPVAARCYSANAAAPQISPGERQACHEEAH